jgi:hypothetical protein
MVEGQRYLIKNAERVTTLRGPTVRFVISDMDFSLYEIFLPQKYAHVTDADIEHINASLQSWYIKYEGYCKIRRLPILKII